MNNQKIIWFEKAKSVLKRRYKEEDQHKKSMYSIFAWDQIAFFA